MSIMDSSSYCERRKILLYNASNCALLYNILYIIFYSIRLRFIVHICLYRSLICINKYRRVLSHAIRSNYILCNFVFNVNFSNMYFREIHLRIMASSVLNVLRILFHNFYHEYYKEIFCN
jgi:hypothetical protein